MTSERAVNVPATPPPIAGMLRCTSEVNGSGSASAQIHHAFTSFKRSIGVMGRSGDSCKPGCR